MATITNPSLSRTMTTRLELFSLVKVAPSKLILYEPGSGGFHRTLLFVLLGTSVVFSALNSK